MFDKAEVIAFFDERATRWDAMEISDRRIINTILDNAGVCEGKRILDVACGTGILIPYYIERNVQSVTGIDISPKMIDIARQKYDDPRVKFYCMDAEAAVHIPAEATAHIPADTAPAEAGADKAVLSGDYDVIMIYNAFPHFSDPEVLFSSLCTLLSPGGTIAVAHGMSRKSINEIHEGPAASVSNGLPEAETLARLMSRYVRVTQVISTEEMYQVAGEKQI